MPHILHNPDRVPAPMGNYAHGLEVKPNARYLFISGQIPGAEDGEVPATFEAQCHVVWNNILRILESAGMGVHDLVKVTTFLTHPDQATANGLIRQQYLGAHRPALTVMVAQTLQSQWLLEIEAVAAKE